MSDGGVSEHSDHEYHLPPTIRLTYSLHSKGCTSLSNILSIEPYRVVGIAVFVRLVSAGTPTDLVVVVSVRSKSRILDSGSLLRSYSHGLMVLNRRQKTGIKWNPSIEAVGEMHAEIRNVWAFPQAVA